MRRRAAANYSWGKFVSELGIAVPSSMLYGRAELIWEQGYDCAKSIAQQKKRARHLHVWMQEVAWPITH